ERKCGAMIVQNHLIELDPSIRQRQLVLENATRARMATNIVVRRGLLTIPVIVHVVFQTAAHNISDGQIQSQMEVLNRDFRMRNADINSVPEVWRPLVTDAQLAFELADVTRTQTTHGPFTTDESMKFAGRGGHDVVDPDTYL